MAGRPRLIVFDLDYTLWPFWVDTHVDPPFSKKDGKIYDGRNKVVKPYRDVPEILERLKAEGYEMGVASSKSTCVTLRSNSWIVDRTPCIDIAEELLSILNWKPYFKYSEIYPRCKLDHFKRFHQASGVPYNEMLFFDDEYRNIKDVSSLGVTCIEVESQEGLSNKVLEQGLQEFASKNR